MPRARVLVLGLALVLAPGALGAQDSAAVAAPAATPQFHAGQWGAQFGVGNGFYGIGALRFTSPSVAWAFSGNVRASHSSEGSGSATTDFYSSGIAVGRRWYRPGAGRVRPFTELGVSTAYNWSEADYGAYGTKQHGYVAGGYGQIGAMVFLAPELSVGGAWSANLGYNHDHYENTGPYSYSSDRSGFNLDAGRVQLVGALYF